MKTQEALVDLGFVETEDGRPGGVSYVYDLDGNELRAVEAVNRYFNPVFLVTGVIIGRGRRTIAQIEGELPTEVESMEQAAALLAYMLRSHEIHNKPFWFTLGINHQDALPWRQKSGAARQKNQGMA